MKTPNEIAELAGSLRSPMKYGFAVLDRPSVPEQLELAQLAEENGYSSIWVCETRLARDAISVMGAIAARTQRIQIGSGVVNTWNRNPALMAMTFATLNNLAPDRVIMGLGAYWDPLAAKQGIVRSKPLTQMRQYVDVVRRLLALEENVTFKSDLLSVDGLSLDLGHGDPRVPQNVPIYLGPTGPKMMELAGEVADGALINGLLKPDYIVESIEHIRIGAERAGRALDDIAKPVYVNVALDEDGDNARRAARRLYAMYLGQQPHIGLASGLPEEFLAEVKRVVGQWPSRPEALDEATELVTEDIALNYIAAGTREECQEQLKKWEATGVDEIVILPLTENYEAMIEAFRPAPALSSV
ncbi:LLM class flavin-dependent oxidoreductase [Ruicaihuangia caeni]|uniref:LLM class flavin-dependent oxidoreductase n=1 Tax=Ruicaihuangia caeni TaxID=3042517 RepID=A0AAW6T4L1_9MICO|nr:LLM class flavin-dependent oxidoreductase [Klugiella sp. YN-L-19]MDI2098647.1 LLM class flavin-dependent oxidoreductase [Klugiella sp. YN-L-19]